MEKTKKYAIFGAGAMGEEALKKYQKENVRCFIDNDRNKQGSLFCGIPVVGLNAFLRRETESVIVIALRRIGEVVSQLGEHGIREYEVFWPGLKSYYPTDCLIYNPYENRREAPDEETWNRWQEDSELRDYIYEYAAQLSRERHLFDHVEIETYNRCNGGCAFCPVSVKNDTRTETRMEEALFEKIIEELADLQYRGRIALFSNNEPFLDERILRFHETARKRLPLARFHLFTNGTLLTLDKFQRILPCLDELVIDNYRQDLELIPSCREIVRFVGEHPELVKKVTIVLRKPLEILTTRGGDAPNRRKKVSYGKDRCILPFKQLIIRPDGKVSLCCNDPLGRNTLGDASRESLWEIWYGKRYDIVRKSLLAGRENWEHCRNCDTFISD